MAPGRAREEVARSEAVADRPGADAHRIGRHLQEGVERDDLVHLAASDVHVVGESVRELHRDRADLAAHAAEVVEEARPLARELRKERREAQHVHAPSLFRARWPPECLRPRAPALVLEPTLAGCRPGVSSPRAAAERPVPRAASPRGARRPARGSAPGFARPGRRREARCPPGPRRAASASRSERRRPRRGTTPRPASTTSVRVARPARSSAKRASRSRKRGGGRSVSPE